MTPPLYALVAFCAWTLTLLVAGIAPYRVGKVLLGQAKPNSFPASTPHGPDWYQRLLRAHLNCVENLPVFGGLVLVGAVSGLRDPTFDLLSQVYIVARVAQSIAHVSSGRNLVINIRFTFFSVQACCAAGMIWLLL